jgi:methylornithine synthase
MTEIRPHYAMITKDRSFKLEDILEKSLSRKSLSGSEITYLLGLTEENALSRLFQTAQNVRAKNFGDKVFLYGFVYFSTFCRNNCTFCASRVSNKLAHRYRKSESEIVAAASRLAESGVHLIDLTMGEDPFFTESESGFESLLALIHKVKKATALPIMISPGVVPERVLQEFARTGVDWYACYQETHNRRLFHSLRPEQDYDSRFASKAYARRLGILIEEGIMTGVGESVLDIADSLEAIQALGAHQARVMSFVPQAGTPMSYKLSPSRLIELKTIAVLRLMFPDRLIPASLDVDGLDLVQERLEAGANVITSLIPPRLGLSGVSQPSLGIDEGLRPVRGVSSLLDQIGMAAASHQDYFDWIRTERSALFGDRYHSEVTT